MKPGLVQHFLDNQPWSQNMGQAEVNLSKDGNKHARKFARTKAYKHIMSKLKPSRRR